MRQFTKYTDDEKEEVLAALETIRGQCHSISKSRIWSEIDLHHEKYPALSSRAPKRVLCIISYVMNERYEIFGNDTGRQIRNAVWELNRQKVMI